MNLKQSYFALVNRLNHSNKIKDEITEPYFFIINEQLYLGLNSSQKLVICYCPKGRWIASEITGFDDFEQEIVVFMNNPRNDQNNLDTQIKKLLFK